MWVFGSLCSALIPKHWRNKLGAKICKCIFLGYSTNSKVYMLYDEENKKFILSQDVNFLESAKDASTIYRPINHLDRFTSNFLNNESNNDIPHPERGISILYQSVDFLH